MSKLIAFCECYLNFVINFFHFRASTLLTCHFGRFGFPVFISLMVSSAAKVFWAFLFTGCVLLLFCVSVGITFLLLLEIEWSLRLCV